MPPSDAAPTADAIVGISIYSGEPGLGGALTNPTELSRRKGAIDETRSLPWRRFRGAVFFLLRCRHFPATRTSLDGAYRTTLSLPWSASCLPARLPNLLPSPPRQIPAAKADRRSGDERLRR